MSEQEEEIYAAWVSDAQAWRAAQDAWAHWLDTLIEKRRTAPMVTSEQSERDEGGKWLYLLWIEEWHVFIGHETFPWHDLDEEIREHYRRLWDKVSEGFAARRM